MVRELGNQLLFDDEDEGDTLEELPPPITLGTSGKNKPASSSSKKPRKDTSSLFLREDGTSIPFYILPKGVDPDVVATLKERIEACQGKVLEKLPKNGYALVDQRTESGVNLMHVRTTPTRFIVSMLFVEESIARGEIVPYEELKLFIDEDKPVLFHLHESLAEDRREKLHDSIMLRGGDPEASLDKAQVVIYSHPWSGLSKLRQEYTSVSDFRSPDWLETCIAKKTFVLGEPPERTAGRPGRPPGAPRRDFTRKDDECLAVWIALHFGLKLHGRQGNRAYELMVADPQYISWSRRHTWQSWRERYKNHRERIDKWANNYIDAHGLPPEPSDDNDADLVPSFPTDVEQEPKGQSAAFQKPKPAAKRKAQDDDMTNSAYDQTQSEHTGSFAKPPPAKRPRQKTPSSLNALKASSSQQPVVFFPPPPPPPPSPPLSSPLFPPIATLNDDIPTEAEPPQPPERASSQEETQASVEMESLDFQALLDPALNTDNAKAMLDAQRAELSRYPAAEESDADVDVVGVTQTQLNQLRPMESIEFTHPRAVSNDVRAPSVQMVGNDSDVTVVPSETFKQQLQEIASEHGIFLGLVRGYFEQELADEQGEEEALENTREYAKKLAKERRKKKAGKGRAGSTRVR